MRIGRFFNNDTREEVFGVLKDDKVIVVNENGIFEENVGLSLSQLEVLTPIMPNKIVAVGLNYKQHAEELKMKLPDEPIIFIKPVTSCLPSGGVIRYPSGVERLDYEAELAIVIAKGGKDIPVEKANEYIMGYTPFNDVTARDLQSKDGQWTRAKGFDTFAPFGPYIVTDIDPGNLRIQTLLNGKIMQDSNTSDMIFSIPEIVAFISSVMTLEAGDVIATGTPQGIGAMNKGDEVIIRIEGMDDLVNTVG